jgi:DedD protein
VTDLTQHDADDGFHEIQLSGKQLVFLFMAGTTVAVMIFLCGVWVGRGVPNDRGVPDNADTMAAATPPPAATPSQPAASGGPPSSEPPAPASERDDELSYAKRLQAESAPREKLKSPSPAPQPAPPREAQPKEATPAPPQAKPEPAAPQMTARAGTWIVQVVSLQDRSAATTIARRLSAKGYPAFVLDPGAGGPRIYRVQVGGYTDKNEAEQASRRLERDEQFKPFVRAR